MIYVDELKEKYAGETSQPFVLNPVIGEYDDPARQRQLVMRLPITEEGNTIVYGVADSGKTTFLKTMIYSLMEEHTPDEVNLYLLDFSSETLMWYKDAPHVGDVVLSHEAEKIENLFKMLNKEVATRKKQFSPFGGDYRSFIKYSDTKVPSIVVVIHNYSAFSEMYEQYEETISYLTREGLKYGIYFIMTALNTGAVRYKLLQNFKQLYVLQLNDPTEYTGVLGSVDGVYPSKFKGRGIFKTDNVYEFQIAHISKKAADLYTFVVEYSRKQQEKWQKNSARRIPILPDRVDIDYLQGQIQNFKTNLVPIGIDKDTLNLSTFDLKTNFVNVVTANSSYDYTPFMQGLAELFATRNHGEVIILDPGAAFAEDDNRMYRYVSEPNQLEEAIVELFDTLVYRNNTTKDAMEEGKEAPMFDELICIVESFNELTSQLSPDGNDKLKVFLDKGNSLNVTLIISDPVDKLNMITFEPWFQNQVSLQDCIWIGNGIADQYVLKLNKITNDMYSELQPMFGYAIVKGKPKLVKLLASKVSHEGVVQYA
jgi:S-DNA-T family DNA segregation ATPase FtsK/SpoIIIE